MIGGMGKIISGRTAFAAAVIGTVGVYVGVRLWWDAFCLLDCTLVEQNAGDDALLLLAVSFLLVIGASVVAFKAVRRRVDRRWAVAALWVAGVPLAFGLVVVPLFVVVLGS